MVINSPKDLALHLEDKRKRLRMSQSTVADLIGLKQDTISKFENKPIYSRIDTLFRILSALELELILVDKNATKEDNIEW